jgi:hypothetical protein
VHGVVFNGKRGTVVTVIGRTEKWSWWDSAIDSIWPSWRGTRYGHREWGPMRKLKEGVDPDYSQKRLKAILTRE